MEALGAVRTSRTARCRRVRDSTGGSSETFDPQQRAGLHAIEMNKPAPDFFEGGVLGNGGLGVIVCTRPDAVVLYFGHNNVWDIRLAENNRDKLLTFDEVWERLRSLLDAGRPRRAVARLLARRRHRDHGGPRPLPGHLVQGLLRDGRRELRPGIPAPVAMRIVGPRFRPPEGRAARASRPHRHAGYARSPSSSTARSATLEIFVEMTSDRLWMRMIDADGVPIEAPFDRARLIPEAGVSGGVDRRPETPWPSGRCCRRSEMLATRTGPSALGFASHGSVAPEFVPAGPFVGSRAD